MQCQPAARTVLRGRVRMHACVVLTRPAHTCMPRLLLLQQHAPHQTHASVGALRAWQVPLQQPHKRARGHAEKLRGAHTDGLLPPAAHRVAGQAGREAARLAQARACRQRQRSAHVGMHGMHRAEQRARCHGSHRAVQRVRVPVRSVRRGSWAREALCGAPAASATPLPPPQKNQTHTHTHTNLSRR
jgi:hypothetical protein